MKSFLLSILFSVVFIVACVQITQASQITHLILSGVSTPITKTIRHLQPGISWNKANEHAWSIYRHAERTGIDWKKIVAITFQESSFRYFKGDKACGLSERGEYLCVHRAFGPMHVYFSKWRDKLNLDPFAMMHALKYGYNAGMAVLETRRRQYKNDPLWYGRYNSNTKRFKRRYANRIDSIVLRINKFLQGQMRK